MPAIITTLLLIMPAGNAAGSVASKRTGIIAARARLETSIFAVAATVTTSLI